MEDVVEHLLGDVAHCDSDRLVCSSCRAPRRLALAEGGRPSALRRRIAEEPQDGDLRAALQRVSGETRARGLHGEHVILLVKQLWGELAEATQHLAPEERRLMLERLVTRCLDEYYSGA